MDFLNKLFGKKDTIKSEQPGEQPQPKESSTTDKNAGLLAGLISLGSEDGLSKCPSDYHDAVAYYYIQTKVSGNCYLCTCHFEKGSGYIVPLWINFRAAFEKSAQAIGANCPRNDISKFRKGLLMSLLTAAKANPRGDVELPADVCVDCAYQLLKFADPKFALKVPSYRKKTGLS